MDFILKRLVAKDFVRVCNKFSEIIVVNCVPGFGKTTFIKELLAEREDFEAYTFGAPELANLTGKYIKSACLYKELHCEGKKVIVDEYTEGDFKELHPVLIFGDPQQSVHLQRIDCNFIGKCTKRFGKNIAIGLTDLGFEISSNFEGGEFAHKNLFEGTLKGQVIAVGSEISQLLRDHCAEFKEATQVRGSTFETVTVCAITAKAQDRKTACELYVALTRATKSLTLLSLDVSPSTT